jgi:hypothetical protein
MPRKDRKKKNKQYIVTGSLLAGMYGGPNTQVCGGPIRGGDLEGSSSPVTSVNVRKIDTVEVCGDQNESERKRRHWNLNEEQGLQCNQGNLPEILKRRGE